MELTSVSAIRGVTPRDVARAVEAYLEGAGLAPPSALSSEAAAGLVQVMAALDGWTVLTWPSYFAPQDLLACRLLSRELHTVVSAVTTTDTEGWSHALFGCGTELDKHHSYPAGLAWDNGDVRALAEEWRGDHDLVARVAGVEACAVRRHFCQATSATRDHPGRDRNGYLGLWSALGIRVPDETYAALPVAPAWSALTAD